MLQLLDNAAVIAVALVASLMAWIFGGTRGDLLLPVVPWVFVLMIEVIFCFPQRHRGESAYAARERVWRAMKSDPLVWVALGFLVLLMVPFVNNGLCQLCDARAIAQGLDPDPALPVLPFCVNRMDHLNVVLWFATALSALVLVRHGLVRRGKRLVLELIVWNGVAVAVLGFVQSALNAPGPLWSEMSGLRTGKPGDFFATFGYPNMGGDYFVTLFGLSLAFWRERCERHRQDRLKKRETGDDVNRPRQFWRNHYFLIPAAVFFFAALNTLSRAAIILATVTAVIYFAHTLVSFLSHRSKAKRVIVGVWSLVLFGVLIFFATLFMPENLQREVDTLDTTTVLDRVTGRGQYHVQVATEIWKDHWLFGCGGWGYVHFCVPKMRELKIDLKSLQMVGGINVHNDYLQFMAEHGLVGFGALVALVTMLLVPIGREWRLMVKGLRFKKGKDLPPRPIQIFALPAPAFFILVTVTATLVHAFGDCPLRSPAVLTLFFVSLAAIPGFMPRTDPQAVEAADGHHHHHHHHHHHQSTSSTGEA